MAESNANLEEKLSASNSEPNSELEAQSKEFAPISTPRDANRGDAQSRRSTSLKSLHQTRSHNGYGCDDHDNEADTAEQNMENGGPAEKDPFEVHWDGGESDPMNPRSMSAARKWLVVLIVSASSLCVTCTSSIYTSTYTQLEDEFGISRIVATLGLSLFIMGLGIGPMLLGPLSEFYGRRPIYLVSFSFFIIWLIPSAVAHNIQTMLIARFLDGLSGSAFLSVAGGTVGDMYNREQLQLPMLIYTASPFVGPSIGPLIGGFINQYTTWRWTFYVLLIWSAANLGMIALLVPETYHPVLLRNKARKLRKETGDERWKAPLEKTDKSIRKTIGLSLLRPFQLLIFEPMCTNLCLFSAILLGILYLFFGAFPVVFEGQHGFTLSQTGLAFLGIFAGMVAGAMTDPFWHKNYARLIKQREEITGEVGGSEPEYRLPPAIAGAFLVPTGLFLFAWTTYSSVHWIIPIIGSAIFGMGTLLVFSGIFTFLVDAYPLYAASSLAANSFARSSFGAAFPLFGVQMYHKLGNQWATSLLAFLTVAMMPFPIIFFKYGKKIRGKSRFASA
ncbi:MFS general substrate transporter [Glarea lozoyensis ATCC 20868]|uniref:MFS general substrate transporter n=1 Tax=Glarea lozoyensis (strain ATCC 20868 / MF5171) TaxID=1116229 RepID=S3DFI1_GLAL2|nr:MFS general substrate transporter [Glarea lozoyensis ATCC 20868]EPE25398.1 MFS general substrate transporter [Glarea lozoyensis ATCC 20868]